MKKSLFSVSMAALLASTSITAWASSVTIPNTFTSGTPALASEVNANFTAVKTSVDDNDSRVTTNTGNIATNTADVATNTADIATNTADVATNTADIATNTADVATNTADVATNTADIATNAADITALQGASSCPSDMTAVGPLCVDTYEAGVWSDAAGTAIQYGLGGAPDYPCLADASDCSGLIFAVNRASDTPSRRINWYQAAQACLNVGKRLPTTAEWQLAANGTPTAVPADPTLGCNVVGAGGAIAVTGASSGAGAAACASSTGVFDMLGNVWEWSADLANMPNPTGGFDQSSSDGSEALILGSAYNLGIVDTHSVSVVDSGPLDTSGSIGFRCVK